MNLYSYLKKNIDNYFYTANLHEKYNFYVLNYRKAVNEVNNIISHQVLV